MTPEVRAALEAFMNEIPFNVLLGMRVEMLSEGYAKMVQPFRDELIGDMRRPAIHGGVTSAVIDTCGGAAVFTRVGRKDTLSTVDLRVDYLRPGRCEPIIVEAKVIRLGNRVGVADMVAYQSAGPDAPIAAGRGVYNIIRNEG